MKRLLARILIRRSIDSDQPLPDWVKTLIKNDPPVAQFFDRSRIVPTMLCKDAEAWVEAAEVSDAEDSLSIGLVMSDDTLRAPEKPSNLHATSSGNAAVIRLGYAVGIGAIAVLCWWGLAHRTPPPTVEPPLLARQELDRTIDIRPVIATLAAGQQVYGQVSDSTRSVIARVIASTKLASVGEQMGQADEARRILTETVSDIRRAVGGIASTLTAIESNATSEPDEQSRLER